MNRIRLRSAFTLIELLVVIAIIAILAAILFPVFAQAREKARQTACLSNFKEIGLGVIMYVQDYDETFPMAVREDAVEWSTLVQPYIKNGGAGGLVPNGDDPYNYIGGIFSCPSFPFGGQANNLKPRTDLFPYPNCQADASDSCTGPNANYYQAGIYTLADVPSPASSIALIEAGANGTGSTGDPGGWSYAYWCPTEWYWGGGGGANQANPDPITSAEYTNGDCDQPQFDSKASAGGWETCSMYPRFRHSNTSNMAYLDGHVKSKIRGSINWGKDIYIPHVKPSDAGFFDNPTPSWYPW